MTIQNQPHCPQSTDDRKKIFITDIDSPLGFHIVQCLRDDHQILQAHSYIVGSHFKGSDTIVHPSIHRIINADLEKTLLAKAIFESDVVIIDLQAQRSWVIEYIIELLTERGEDKNSSKKCILVGISSHMTWVHLNKKIEISAGMDKELQLGKIMSLKSSQSDTQKHKEEEQANEEISIKDQKKRCPHYLWNWHFDQQQKIIELRNHTIFKVYMIISGLIYGKDFPNSILINLLTKACQNQSITCYGDGSNAIPTTYIDDLITEIDYAVNKQGQKNDRYLFIVDNSTVTQLQIVEALKNMAGTQKQVNFQPRKYLTRQQSQLSCCLSMKRHSNCFNSYNIVKYLSQNANQIKKYLQFTPIRIYIDKKQLIRTNSALQNQTKGSNPIQNNPNQDRLMQLKQIWVDNGIKIIEEQDLDQNNTQGNQNESLCAQKMVIFEEKLRKNPFLNFVFLGEECVMSEQMCSDYGIYKFNGINFEEEKKKIISQYGLTYHAKEVEQVEGDKEDMFLQNQQIMEQGKQDKNDNNMLELDIDKINSTNSIALPQKISEQIQVQEKQINKPRIAALKLDQYMLDNVLTYVSEAFIKLSYSHSQKNEKPELSDFVQKLKEIYNRELTLKQEISLP